MAWVEVPKTDVFDKLETGSNLAIAIFPEATFNKNVDMTDKTEAGKIYQVLDDDNVMFFEKQ